MVTYKYPKVSGGYRWNMLKRCLYEVGIEPVNTSDIGEETWLQFSRELTASEQAALNTLMTSNPTYPPGNDVTIVKIQDIWEKFEAFKSACGLPNLKLYYSESIPGSGNIDTIEIHNPTPLSNSQKNILKGAYSALLS